MCASNAPLDDVCRALGRPRVVRVGPRGVRGAARANDSQFVAQSPAHAQLSRAGAAHRAAAHGEAGDHGRAVVGDVVELHRAHPRVRNVPRGARVLSCAERPVSFKYSAQESINKAVTRLLETARVCFLGTNEKKKKKKNGAREAEGGRPREMGKKRCPHGERKDSCVKCYPCPHGRLKNNPT